MTNRIIPGDTWVRNIGGYEVTIRLVTIDEYQTAIDFRTANLGVFTLERDEFLQTHTFLKSADVPKSVLVKPMLQAAQSDSARIAKTTIQPTITQVVEQLHLDMTVEKPVDFSHVSSFLSAAVRARAYFITLHNGVHPTRVYLGEHERRQLKAMCEYKEAVPHKNTADSFMCMKVIPVDYKHYFDLR